MNTLNIVFSYDYVSKLVSISWDDLLFAINHGFMKQETLIEHAINVASNEEEPSQMVIDLACLTAGESAQPFINLLSDGTNNEDDSKSREKFLYLLLNWIYEHQDLYSDPLEAVEYVYADFDYPEEITKFVRYMPASEPVNQSLQLNRERLFNKWEQYLKDRKEEYSSARGKE